MSKSTTHIDGIMATLTILGADKKPVDAETAKAVGDTFFEVIIASGFEDGALEILKTKKNLIFYFLGGGV